MTDKKIARNVCEDLRQSPVILTANHHGIDYFAQSVQGALALALGIILKSRPGSTVPVMACANIPLNNLTYPMGFLLYDIHSEGIERTPHKIPVFPNRLKRSLVSAVKSFDKTMLDRAIKRIRQMKNKQEISRSMATTAIRIINEEYNSREILEQSYYSRQSVIGNYRIWKKLM